jgi:hypothetical protein
VEAVCSFAWEAVLEPAAVRCGCVTVEVDTEKDMVANVGGCVVWKQLRSNSNCKLLCGVQDEEMTARSVERFGLDRHTWPNHNPMAVLDPAFSRLHNRLLRSGTGETFRFPYHVVGREGGSEWFSVVDDRTWKMELFMDCEYSRWLAIAA